jgi:hypothetical protein
MISIIFSILIVGIIVGLILWLVDYIGIIPEPFAKVIKIVVVVFAVIWLISVLLPLIGGGTVTPLNLK